MAGTEELSGGILFPRHRELQQEQYPRDAVQDKVKPVKRADKPALEEHGQLFHNVRRLVRSQAKGQAENYYP